MYMYLYIWMVIVLPSENTHGTDIDIHYRSTTFTLSLSLVQSFIISRPLFSDFFLFSHPDANLFLATGSEIGEDD